MTGDQTIPLAAVLETLNDTRREYESDRSENPEVRDTVLAVLDDLIWTFTPDGRSLAQFMEDEG